jgi:hypothetical protein
MLPSRQAGEVLVSIEISMDNALAIRAEGGTPCGVLQVRSSAEGRSPARETKRARDHDSEKPSPEEPFINLSSTAAFVCHLFALKAVIAAIKFSNIHIDQLPPEQKVVGSNPLGRTITPFISTRFLVRLDGNQLREAAVASSIYRRFSRFDFLYFEQMVRLHLPRAQKVSCE